MALPLIPGRDGQKGTSSASVALRDGKHRTVTSCNEPGNRIFPLQFL